MNMRKNRKFFLNLKESNTQKADIPLSIYSVNVTKFALFRGFGNIDGADR